MPFGSKAINIWHIINFRARDAPNVPPEDKSLEIYKVSQNRLNSIKVLKFDVNSRKPDLGS